MYVGLAYVTYATQGFYPYAFLNPANGRGRLAGYIVGIAAACAVIFVIVWGLIWIRRRFTRPGKRSKNDNKLHVRPGASQDLEMTAK